MIAAGFICFAILVAAWLALPSPKVAAATTIEVRDMESEEAALAA